MPSSRNPPIQILQAYCHGVPVSRWTWTSLPGWRPSASRLDSFLVDNACGHRRLWHWMYHLHDCPLSATVRSPSPRHEHGTICRLMWRHQIPWKPSKLNKKSICSWGPFHRLFYLSSLITFFISLHIVTAGLWQLNFTIEPDWLIHWLTAHGSRATTVLTSWKVTTAIPLGRTQVSKNVHKLYRLKMSVSSIWSSSLGSVLTERLQISEVYWYSVVAVADQSWACITLRQTNMCAEKTHYSSLRHYNNLSSSILSNFSHLHALLAIKALNRWHHQRWYYIQQRMNLAAVQTLDSDQEQVSRPRPARTTRASFLVVHFCTAAQLQDDESRLSVAVQRSHATGN